MTKSAFVKILLTVVAALVLACTPKTASGRHDGGSRRGGGSHGGGSSHGGNSHGGGGFKSGGSRGGGHFSFKGDGRSSGGSYGGGFRGGNSYSGGNFKGGGSFSAKRGGGAFGGSYGGGYANGGRMNDRSLARSGGFFSRQPNNSGRNFNFGGESSRSFGGRGSNSHGGSRNIDSPTSFRNFDRSEGWQSMLRSSGARNFGGNSGGWNSFRNSSGRSMPASARSWGNAMGGGTQMSRGHMSNARSEGQWHSFGSLRTASSREGNFASNVSAGWSSFGRNRGTSSYMREPRMGFGSKRFSSDLRGGSRFSSFSSFSSGRSISNFGGSRFGNAGFGGFDFGNSGFGYSGFGGSFIGSDLSIIPNLLFGGLLHVGPSLLGGPAFLGANVLAFAASSIVSALVSNGNDQGGFTGSNVGFGAGGYDVGPAFGPAAVGPPCGFGVSFARPGWSFSGYCAPYPTYSTGWSGGGYYGGFRSGYNAAGYFSGNSDFN